MTIAETILNQMGGHQFIVMTGVKQLIEDGNTLRMTLPKNASKANRLWVTLDNDDTYTMYFFKLTAGRLNKKTFTFSEYKEVEIYKISGIYFNQLQDIFTKVTGMYIYL